MKSGVAIILFLFLAIVCNAQTVTGSWYGMGKAETANLEGNTYLTELVLNQKGKTVTGRLNFYFRDSLFSNEIVGYFDPASRVLNIKPTKIIYYKASNTEVGVDCPVEAYLTLRVSRVGSVLSGGFYATKDFKYTCPTINFKLKKNEDKEDEVPMPIVKEEVEEDSTALAKTVVTVVDVPQLILSKEDKHSVQLFAERTKVFAREIKVEQKKIRLEFYDNGAIDNDSIAVFFNNKMVLSKTKLEHQPIQLTVDYDDNLPYNELSMFAESLGFIPPNTAALIIYDGTKRYEVLMTSDFTKSASIKFIRKKE